MRTVLAWLLVLDGLGVMIAGVYLSWGLPAALLVGGTALIVLGLVAVDVERKDEDVSHGQSSA